MAPSKPPSVQFDKFYNVIDGKPRSASSFHNGIDPTTKEKLWDVPIATKQDVDDAVTSAALAFQTWKDTTFEIRRDYLLKLSEIFSMLEDHFVDLLCAETGKPRTMAVMEVKSVGMWCDQNAKYQLPVEHEEIEDRFLRTTFKPVGVCVGICPWNFPLTLATGKFAPALMAGNTMIIKPSPYTPYSTLKLIEIAQEAFPPGVLQVVGGDDSLGPMLTSHPDVALNSFTGSVATGRKVGEVSAKGLKRCVLELGGNDASIILPDVDIPKVAPQVAMGAFANSGQICVATKRIYVHESIYRPFVDAMINFTKSLKVGSSNEQGVMIGPIQNSMQYDKVKDFFADTKSKGYKFAVGMPDVEQSKGYFIQPTIIDNPPNESRIIQEEPFGPIVPTQPWSDEEEVITRANDTRSGLGACVWAHDVAHAQRIADRLEAGSVWVNSFEKATPGAFFSGHKESGIGGAWGKMGLQSYTNAHVIHTAKDGPA